MDAHTIRGLRDQAGQEGREPKPLAFIRVEDDLSKLVSTLSKNKCSMTPVLTCDPSSTSNVGHPPPSPQ